ncbi:hypothetical protein V8F20_010697 [Naviculisporaceae sp. PSN 640]
MPSSSSQKPGQSSSSNKPSSSSKKLTKKSGDRKPKGAEFQCVQCKCTGRFWTRDCLKYAKDGNKNIRLGCSADQCGAASDGHYIPSFVEKENPHLTVCDNCYANGTSWKEATQLVESQRAARGVAQDALNQNRAHFGNDPEPIGGTPAGYASSSSSKASHPHSLQEAQWLGGTGRYPAGVARSDSTASSQQQVYSRESVDAQGNVVRYQQMPSTPGADDAGAAPGPSGAAGATDKNKFKAADTEGWWNRRW